MKPRYHYGVDVMLRLCNGSATVSTEREALDRLCVRLNMYLVTIIVHNYDNTVSQSIRSDWLPVFEAE